MDSKPYDEEETKHQRSITREEYVSSAYNNVYIHIKFFTTWSFQQLKVVVVLPLQYI